MSILFHSTRAPRAPAFRRPTPPFPIERYDIQHPDVPESLEGLTILHVTDLHTTRPGIARAGPQRIIRAVAAEHVDLVILTGDYMTRPGQEPAAVMLLSRLAAAWRARFGAFGIFGNHDSPEVARRARAIPGITWLENQYATIPGLPLTILGLSYPEDLLSTLLNAREDAGAASNFNLLLAHYPTEIFPAASAGIPLMLAGHTHGGQLRMGRRLAAHTSCDLPPHLASGILQLDRTLCVISRGLGEAILNFRINCPPQMPLLTLRRGPLAEREAGRVAHVRAW